MYNYQGGGGHADYAAKAVATPDCSEHHTGPARD